MRIAIVEDEIQQADLLRKYIDKWSLETGESIQSDLFSDGLFFLEKYQADYDLIFLDIMMPRINGLDTAKKIREKDENVILIFVTNIAQYAQKGYEVSAFDFIVKPFNEYDISFRLSKAKNKLQRENEKYLIVRCGASIKRICARDLYYVDVMKHCLSYHTAYGVFREWNRALSDIEKELPKDSFSRCTIGILVNLIYVKEITFDSIILKNNETLPLSRGKKNGFTEAFLYMGGK